MFELDTNMDDIKISHWNPIEFGDANGQRLLKTGKNQKNGRNRQWVEKTKPRKSKRNF